MGLEIAIGAAAAAASVATGVASMSNAKKANRERQEASAIQSANQKNEAGLRSHRAAREARVRQAMILQQSENTGVMGSSGQISSVGLVGTNLGIANAQASSQTNAIMGINAANQRAANYDYRAARIGAFGDIFQSSMGSFQKSYS